MSNAPPTLELLRVPDGMKKVTMEMDTKIPNAATFKILREDHTLGNMVRMKLLDNPKVIFAGYKMPHPLEHDILLKIQTTADTTPIQVLQDELNNLIAEVSGILKNFQDEMTLQGMNDGMEDYE
ncbi:DNA-directed RNA polymerase II core subunit [Boothiomyces sp. JEL0866]|nr:DNA-directed RNA polymerase II core subunit [Boothiomyces sp. JEL0866]